MNIPLHARSCRCLLPSLVVPLMAMRLPPTAVGTVTLFAIASLACGLDTATKDQADSTGTATLVAPDIIARMSETYANCGTYTDTGTVTTIFKSERGNRTVVKRFSTAMVRPDRFRFEYSEERKPNSRYVVWRSGGNIRTWWDVTKKSKRIKSLGLALAGATGVSSGSAHTIPALLMRDEVRGRRLTNLQVARRGDDMASGNRMCFTIEALYAGRPITIWIDQESFLVRRIDKTTEFEDFSTDESTTYKPVIDEEVPPNLLDYNAPIQADGEGVIVSRLPKTKTVCQKRRAEGCRDGKTTT